MAGKKIQGIDGGINGAVPSDQIRDGDAVPGSINCLYCDGMIQTADGYEVVTQNGLPLAGGEILAVFKYTEQDRTEHLLAITKTSVYRRDSTADTWVELEKGSGSVPAEWTLSANIDHPVSWATMDSTDGAVLNNAGSDRAYRHLLMSDGGQTSVKRWAGKYETKRWPLEGGDGYHIDSGPCEVHYARQVAVFQNHVFLVNTREYDSNGILRETFSRLRWGMAGRLESDLIGGSAYLYTNVGAGYRDLVNTGDQNEWIMPLGNQLICYQKRTIWTGISMPSSDDAFSFDVTVEGIGLLSSRLLCSDGNRHFFIGSDNILRSYYGMQQFQVIEGRIGEELRKAIDFTKVQRCFMCLGANYRRLWIFVIGVDEPFSVKAFGLDLRSGSWQVRDYSGNFGITKGVTSANLIGSQAFMAGPSYQDLLDDTMAETYDYGKTIPATTGEDAGSITVDAHSGEYDTIKNTAAKWKTAGTGLVQVGDYLKLAHSAINNIVAGDYVVEGVVSDTEILITGRFDNGVLVPTLAWGDYTIWHIPTGIGYRYIDELNEILADDKLMIGGSDGYIFQHDSDLTEDNQNDLEAKHVTKVFDDESPDTIKLWSGIMIKARGSAITVSYRINDFETEETGWIPFPGRILTDEVLDYTFNIHQSSTAIQFKFENAMDFKVIKMFLLPYSVEDIV